MMLGLAWKVGATAGAVALGLYTLRWAVDARIFAFNQSEQRYAAVGQAARAHTDRNAVIFSGQHSGSLRYYAGRLTLAYFNVAPEHFKWAMQWIADQGGHPYAVLDGWEVDEFRRRFGLRDPFARLAHAPLVAYYNGPDPTFLYDLLPDGPMPPTDYLFQSRAPEWCPAPAPWPARVLK